MNIDQEQDKQQTSRTPPVILACLSVIVAVAREPDREPDPCVELELCEAEDICEKQIINLLRIVRLLYHGD